ncbi:sulfotransferase [Pseudomonadota bacterium]
MNLVFFVGTGRCGSSLIHEIISKHEDVGFISNIDDNLPYFDLKGRWNNQLYRSLLGNKTTKGKLRFAPSEAYKLIARQVSPVYENSCRDLTESDVTPWLKQRFRDFFEQRAAIQGKSIFTHKYTGWSRIGFFSSIFPEAKFIHIVRDGRAVANSWLQMPWWNGYKGPENWLWGELTQPYLEEWKEGNCSFPLLAGIGWKLLLNSYATSAASLSDQQYMEIRLEDIVEQPRDSFEKLLSFSGLPWSNEFNTTFQRNIFSSKRKLAFQDELYPQQLSEIESCLSIELKKHGYI